MPHAAIVITSSAHFQEVLASAGSQAIIIDFTASWCPPCQMIKPIFESLAEQYQGKVVFIKVDVDDQSDIAQQFEVSCMPTFVVLKDGQVVGRMEGANKAGLEALAAKHSK